MGNVDRNRIFSVRSPSMRERNGTGVGHIMDLSFFLLLGVRIWSKSTWLACLDLRNVGPSDSKKLQHDVYLPKIARSPINRGTSECLRLSSLAREWLSVALAGSPYHLVLS